MPTVALVFSIWLLSAGIAGLGLGMLFRDVARGGMTPVRQMPNSAEHQSLRRSA